MFDTSIVKFDTSIVMFMYRYISVLIIKLNLSFYVLFENCCRCYVILSIIIKHLTTAAVNVSCKCGFYWLF